MTGSNGAHEEKRPFRAVDVLSGSIDRRAEEAKRPPARKQISAQLEPSQVRVLGELHARLNAAASTRIEKSDLVGLGIELLAALLGQDDEEFDPAPIRRGRDNIRTADDLRSYVRTHVRKCEDDSGGGAASRTPGSSRGRSR